MHSENADQAPTTQSTLLDSPPFYVRTNILQRPHPAIFKHHQLSSNVHKSYTICSFRRSCRSQMSLLVCLLVCTCTRVFNKSAVLFVRGCAYVCICVSVEKKFVSACSSSLRVCTLRRVSLRELRQLSSRLNLCQISVVERAHTAKKRVRSVVSDEKKTSCGWSSPNLFFL